MVEHVDGVDHVEKLGSGIGVGVGSKRIAFR